MQAWDQFVSTLEKEFGSSIVDQWVRTLKVVRFDAGNLYLEACDSFQIEWFKEHISPRLQEKFLNNNQRPIRIHLSSSSIKNKPHKEATQSSFSIVPDRLDPEMTFENFLASSQNAMGYKLLSEIERSMFNPIYLYGPKGVGKTHLLMAAAASLKQKAKNVFFVRAETFTSHVVQAIRLGLMQQFRKTYREIDALLIDDIDIFSRKDATQEEFFHTFNALHTIGKQLIFTAASPPSKLTEIEPRLISRFEWGISLGIGRGDPQSILNKKASLWKLSYSPELIQFLLDHFPLNPLLAMQALSLRAKETNTITPEKAKFLLGDFLIREKEKALSPEKIVKALASHYGIRSEDLLGKSQMRECVLPRQVAMYLCREKLKLSFPKIGEIFGRDHSTVMSSVKQIQKEEKRAELQEAFRSIENDEL